MRYHTYMKQNIFKVDLLNGPLFKSIVLFSLPLFISQLFQTLYSAFDTLLVGNILGDSSLAAVGSSVSIFDLLNGLSTGLGVGLTIVVSRCFGTNDERKLKNSIFSCLVIGLFSAIFITVISLVFLKPLLTLLNTPAEIFDEAYSYIVIIVAGLSLMFAYNLGSSLLRAIGDSFVPLLFLVFSSVLNIILDYILMAKFHTGVKGAAIATIFSQGISALLCFIYIIKYRKILIPAKEDLYIQKDLFLDMLGQGISMGLMNSIVCVGSVILQYGINGLGQVYIAAQNAARRCYCIMMLPVIGIGLAAPTFVGQNAGAGNFKRIREGLKMMYICDIIFSVIVFIFTLFFAKPMLRLITGSSNQIIIDSGARYVIVAAAFFGVLGILIQSRSALQGLGAKLTPLISSTMEFVGKILFCFVFVPLFKYEAIIWCEPIIWCFMTVQLLFTLWNTPNIKNAK